MNQWRRIEFSPDAGTAAAAPAPVGFSESRAPSWSPTARDAVSMLTGWLLLTAIILTSAARLVAAFPLASVGDNLNFSPTAVEVSAGSRPLIDALLRRPGPAASQRSCQLDIAVMAASRGALTVRAVAPSRILLSWAGGPTAPGQNDCRGGEIQVTASGYARLLATQARAPLGRE